MVLTSAGVYECVKIPRVNELTLALEGLPPEFDGYRIAQMSDIHCSQITPRSRFEEIVKRTNAAKPDLMFVCLGAPKQEFWIKKNGSGKVVTLGGEVLSCEFDGPRSTVSGFGFVSHFSTCPNAGSFRRK